MSAFCCSFSIPQFVVSSVSLSLLPVSASPHISCIVHSGIISLTAIQFGRPAAAATARPEENMICLTPSMISFVRMSFSGWHNSKQLEYPLFFHRSRTNENCTHFGRIVGARGFSNIFFASAAHEPQPIVLVLHREQCTCTYVYPQPPCAMRIL